MTDPRRTALAHRAPGPTKIVQARGRPETVELIERYYFEQEVSRNAFVRPAEDPTGHIEITVPYDGEEYFSRQAGADVAAQSYRSGRAAEQALIGHLLLANHERTDLRGRLRLNDRFGSFPVLVPLPHQDRGDPEQLAADDTTCVIAIDYRPAAEKLREIPIDLDVRLLDPDSTDSLSSDVERLIREQDTHALYRSDVAAQIRQQASFRTHLLLELTVQITLPALAVPPGDRTPVVRRVALDWPTVTSLRSLWLDVDGRERSVSYNPLSRSLEWSDIELHRIGSERDHKDSVVFASPPMLLLVKQPGELYEQPRLDGRVEVEVPGALLSGTQARLFTALGEMARHQPEVSTHVTTSVHLVLDDAFARRALSPFHHLHFDEVIPEERRFADVIAALKDRGFDVEAPPSANEAERFLFATRAEGPDTMKLLLYIEGKQYKTQRTARVADGHTFTSMFDSGEMNIYIRGELPRDSRELIREMNALQRSLREKFDHLRTRR